MNQLLKKIFYPPVFEGDLEKTRSARYLNAILWSATGLLFGLNFLRLFQEAESLLDDTGTVLFGLVGTFLVLILVNKLGYSRTASALLIAASWAGLFYQALQASGIYDSTLVGLIVIVMMTALLLGTRFSLAVTVISIGAVWFIALQHNAAVEFRPPDLPIYMARDYTVIYVLIAVISYLTIGGFREALQQSRTDSTKLRESYDELNNLRANLEKNVEARTLDLYRRTEQLEAVGDISRRTAEIVDVDALLQEAVRLIAERFHYYHAGIFLIDAKNQFAELKAVSSEGGKRMLERQHKLAIASEGIVGHAARSLKAKIALDTGDDPYFAANPDLPLTRSEISLPLIVRNNLLGILDIQSSEPSAFTDDDASTLQTMADQIALAIENAQLLEQSKSALSDAQAAYQQYIKREWSNYSAGTRLIGYRFSEGNLASLEEAVDHPEISAATSGGQQITSRTRTGSGNTVSAIAVPIKLRGEVIGVLDVRSMQSSREWSEDEIAIAQALADRVSLAMENARLFEDASKRAERERQVSIITDKLGSTFQIETILRTAAEEISRAIRGTEVLVQIQPANQVIQSPADPKRGEA